MKFLFCEDRDDIWEGFKRSMEQTLKYRGIDLIRTQMLQDSLLEAGQLTDGDIISLDSRLPTNPGDGEEVLVALRRRGCKCLALWHSSTSVPNWAEKHCYKFNSWFDNTLQDLEDKWQIQGPLVDSAPHRSAKMRRSCMS